MLELFGPNSSAEPLKFGLAVILTVSHSQADGQRFLKDCGSAGRLRSLSTLVGQSSF